jgi:hypothetical protein
LKKKKDTDPDWQALDADADPDEPPPILCRPDRTRIHNTGTVTGINAQICEFLKYILHFSFDKQIREKSFLN